MKARRVLLLVVFATSIFAQCLAQSIIGRQKVDQYPTTAWGTLTYGLTWLPTDYDSSYASSTKYPLIIFLHGSGEGGDGVSGLNTLITQGLPYQIANGMNPEAVNPADGQRYKFIVVSPQAPSAAHWSYSYTQVQWILPNVISRYRIDTTRIYVTGLSAGGAGTMSCVTNGPDFAKKIAAIVPVSCAGTNTQSEADQIPLIGGTYGVKVWNVCGALDAWYSFAQNTTTSINTANPAPSVPAIVTGEPGVGHQPAAWNPPYDVNWRSNSENLNTFEWMLKWKRTASGPSANAGPNQSITLPTNQVSLNGSGSATGGNTITGYSWSEVSGPSNYAIASPSSASTNITNLVQGTYLFRLTVTDNTGAVATSDVTITVNPVPNILPVASAGSDLSITLPVNNVTLTGSGSDADGTIAAYAWTKIAGPASYTIASPSSAQTAITNLAQGVYQFQLSVTDNSGGIGKDTVVVTVNAAPNSPPSASAGPDAVITLPANSVTVNGSGTDTDGTIASYLWTRISGPATYTIASPGQPLTVINNLVQGVYQFQLTVTDNAGATGKDTVMITVNPAPNMPPVANAGPDQAITLPASSVSLNGSATDADGSVASYSWTKISGPASFTITSPGLAQTTVTNLVQGVYQFVLAATDNQGATGKDTVSVTVNPAVNVPPVVNAGNDVSTTLPQDSVMVNGNATDPDGTIASYQWTKISGPASCTIVSSSQPQSRIRNLLQGTYQLQLSATDNSGAVSKDTVTIIVNAAPPPPPPANLLPVANAGSDLSVTLPLDSVQLNGMGTDSDGSITGYQWTKISGPSTYSLLNASTAQANVRNLVQGIYQFELTVTDNSGATARDTVQVTVNPRINRKPVVNAGQDTTLTLPVSSVILSGVATDSDGTIAGYSWSKISGPSQFLIATPAQSQTTISNLIEGTYQFVLAATDNDGAVASDTVTITVKAKAAVVCNGIKRYIIPGGDNGKYMSGDPAATTWYQQVNPGDTLVLSSQYSWSYFSLTEYAGTAQCPIVIRNEGGQVWLTAGIETNNCKYIKIDGSGDPNSYYGFKIYNPAQDLNGVAVSIIGKSRNIEVGRVDVYKKTYGVWAKQDPLCDQSYDYPNFIMDSIEIHHSRFKNIGQDCIYAGNTDPLGKRTEYCNGSAVHFIPMRLSNINIHHLIIDSCNRTGIQLGGANSGYNQIHDNVISRCGYEYNQQQGTGIAIGGMTRNCHVYNNVIKNTFLYGIMSFGVGTNYIENNTIDSTGWLDGVPNTWSRPYNIMCSPKETIPFDSTRIIIRSNKMGLNSTTDDTNIGLVVWGPPTWASGNVLCSNKRLDGVTPAKVYVDPTINYINDCSHGLPNIAPSVFAGNDIIVKTVADTVLHGTASDPDGTIVSYHWTKISGPAQGSINNPDSVKTIISQLVQGTYVFRLTVMDNDSLTASDDIQVSIAPPNVAPIANAGANKTITLPTNTVGMSGGAIDPDGTIVSYQWTKISGPSSFAIVNAADPLTQVNNLVQGTYLFELLVTDDSGAQDRDTVTIKVNPVPPPTNVPPVVNAGNDMTITLPTNFIGLNGSANDPDGSIVSYQWTKLSGPASYFIANASQAQTSVGNLVAGVYVFELAVTDNVGAISKGTVKVTVNPTPNTPPLVNAGGDQVISLPVSTASLNGMAVDADGYIVNYTWTKISGPSQYAFTTSNKASTLVNNLVQGVYQFELTAMDDQGAIGRDTVAITVSAGVNLPPVASAGPDQVITLPVSSVNLTGSGFDQDGSIVSYKWAKISGPSQFVVVSSTQAQTAVNNLVQGVYQFEITVTDNQGAIGKDTVMVTVNGVPNVPPVANAGPDQVITLPVNTVLVNGTGADTDGSIVSYQWARISGPAFYTIGNTASAQTYIHNLVQGVYRFELTVTDNLGATGKDTVTITVNPGVNIPPVADAGNNQTVTLPTNSIALAGNGTDADGYITAYSWTRISGPATFSMVSPNQPQTVVNDLVAGTYQFELKVTDNQGAVGRDTVTVLVEPSNTVSTASLYPNPATTAINIKIDAVTHRNQTSIRIYDLSGVLVYKEEFLRTQPSEVRQVDISRLLPGSYVVIVGADINSDIALKFIKQ